MSFSLSKENILRKIRQALAQPAPVPFPKSENNENVFQPLSQEPDVEFAEQFSKLQGRFVYCVNRQELAFQLNSLINKQGWQKVFCIEKQFAEMLGSQFATKIIADDLAGCDVSVTGCEALVARTGSIVMSAAQPSGRNASVYAPIHICIAFTSQVVVDVKDALKLVKDKYVNNIPSLITFATGPSRTADIEKTLVVGVHGPKEVFCFLVEG
jgi:L-lactate dehydrogenase complex protein LldG